MSPPISRPPGLADYGLLLLLGAIWGSSFMLIKIGVASVPPLTVATSRLVIAFVFLLVMARIAGQEMPRGAHNWGLVVVTGLVGTALPFLLISWGQVRIDSGLSAILMAVVPLATYLLAHVFTADEKLNVLKATGVALGFSGIVVLIGPTKLMSLGQETLGQLAVATASVCYGINALLARKLSGHPPLALVASYMLVSAAVMLPAALFLDRPWELAPTNASLAALLVLGVLQTAIGTALMVVIIRRQGAAFSSQNNFLVPIFGVCWGWLVLSEVLSSNAVAALVLILLGIMLGRLGTRPSPPRPKTDG